MNKFTKIIATIGPATDSKEKIEKLFNSGMNIARLNFSHGNYDYFEKIINIIREVSTEIAILLDTKGPEIRTGTLENDHMILEDNKEIYLTNNKDMQDKNTIYIDYKYLTQLKQGNKLFIDDGLIELDVISIDKNKILTKVQSGGVLGNKKTVSIKGHDVKITFMSQKDKNDILFGIKHNLDFLAASFVRTSRNLDEIRKFLKENNSDMRLISKIEHWKSIDNIQEIIKKSDGVMIARGDLGVEIKIEKVPKIQADIIRYCNNMAKPVIVATHMLESMIEKPVPTRAEVTDIAQAILQGTDALMLSGETAYGKYPIKSIQVMANVAIEYEKQVISSIVNRTFRKDDNISIFMTRAAFLASEALNLKAIITPTESGFTPQNVSSFKPKCPIFAITRDPSVFRHLQLSWGVYPILDKNIFSNLDDMKKDLAKKVYDKGNIDKEDLIAITAGHKIAKTGSTNILEIYKLKDLLELDKAEKYD